MTIPTFDIDYKSAYSTSLEFKTQINEKHLGKEQRYPVWTYPKRVFTLKFDKNFSGRKALEDFYINVSGSSGKFYFKWVVLCGKHNALVRKVQIAYGVAELVVWVRLRFPEAQGKPTQYTHRAAFVLSDEILCFYYVCRSVYKVTLFAA